MKGMIITRIVLAVSRYRSAPPQPKQSLTKTASITRQQTAETVAPTFEDNWRQCMKRISMLVMAALAVCALGLIAFASSTADDEAAPGIHSRVVQAPDKEPRATIGSSPSLALRATKKLHELRIVPPSQHLIGANTRAKAIMNENHVNYVATYSSP